jgi:hypothetical protein
MAQSVCHLELQYKSYDYYNNIFTFSPSKCINGTWGMKNVGQKSMERGEQVGKWLKHEEDVFYLIGLLQILPFVIYHAFLPKALTLS